MLYSPPELWRTTPQPYGEPALWHIELSEVSIVMRYIELSEVATTIRYIDSCRTPGYPPVLPRRQHNRESNFVQGRVVWLSALHEVEDSPLAEIRKLRDLLDSDSPNELAQGIVVDQVVGHLSSTDAPQFSSRLFTRAPSISDSPSSRAAHAYVLDAYQGDINDPMSQKTYMWDRNNPVEYADPSGFYSIAPGTDSAEAQMIEQDAEEVRQWAQAGADYWSKQAGQDAADKAASFQKLADDMTIGKGDLVIHAFSDKSDVREGYVYPQLNAHDVYINFAYSDRQNTLATEGFNAEFQHTDSPYFDRMEQAISRGGRVLPNGWNDDDYYVDQLVNQFFRSEEGAGNPPEVLPYNGDHG